MIPPLRTGLRSRVILIDFGGRESGLIRVIVMCSLSW